MSTISRPRTRAPKRTPIALLALLGAVASLTSCAATSPTVTIDAAPRAMYREMVRDLDRRGGSGAVFSDVVERNEVREDEIMRRVEAGEIQSAEEHFYAGAILVRSSRMEALLLAESLGRRAAILGDERGKPVAAEAVDRQSTVRDLPQTFGTQYAYSVVTGNWMLYPTNPETTDEERAEAGLPPLSWFQGRVDQLNESNRSERLRAELHLPPTRTTRSLR